MSQSVNQALLVKRRERCKHSPFAKYLTDSLSKIEPEIIVADSIIRNNIVDHLLSIDDNDQKTDKCQSYYLMHGPTSESLGITRTICNETNYDKPTIEPNDGELDLSGQFVKRTDVITI
jgi:hypothetical protein